MTTEYCICVPGLILFKSRQDETGGHFRTAEIVRPLLMSGPFAPKNRDLKAPLRNLNKSVMDELSEFQP